MDVEASRAIRQAEVGAARTMIERTEERFGLKPERLAADTAYGSAANLNWLVNDKQIAPHIPVIDKSNRNDGTLSRDDFDKARNVYVCPKGKLLTTTGAALGADGKTSCIDWQWPARSLWIPDRVEPHCERLWLGRRKNLTNDGDNVDGDSGDSDDGPNEDGSTHIRRSSNAGDSIGIRGGGDDDRFRPI